MGIKIDKTSMLYWYPKIKNLKIPQPKTIIYELTKGELLALYNESVPKKLIEKIKPLISELEYPIFARTDYASGKHGWNETCFIKCEDDLSQNIYHIITMNLCADILGLPFEALIFREYISLVAGFKAFYGNMPVAKERRYFINNGKIQCHHPYWPKDAIESPDHENWIKILDEQNSESKVEIELLSNYALMISEVLEGYWSVDFAFGQNRKWYLIDMAEGQKSFHWLECEHCPEIMKIQYGGKIN